MMNPQQQPHEILLQQQQQQQQLPKNDSFNSVVDVLKIYTTDATDDDDVASYKQQQQQQESSSDHNDAVAATTITTTTNTTNRCNENNDTSIRTKKQVRFGSIERREYNRIVGDHPDVRVGPPITFSWEYGTLPSLSLQEYEQLRQEQQSQQRVMGVKKMSSITRKNILRTLFDVSEEDIVAAEREVQVIRKQREHSMKQHDTMAHVESKLRRAGRVVRKSIGKAMFAMAAIPLQSPYSTTSVHAY